MHAYDANWKDKLTTYNGAAITYDAIGNPLTDGTWTYTWSLGPEKVHHWFHGWQPGRLQSVPVQGYVFDEETQMYYLNSRYYYPELRRFINADSVISHNLYVYCANAPIDLVDPSGCIPEKPPGMPTSDWIKYRAYLKNQANPMIKGKHHPSVTYDKVPDSTLVTSVLQMKREGWRYPTYEEFYGIVDGKKNQKPRIACTWGIVDCISVYRFVGIHFKVSGWKDLPTTTKYMSLNNMTPIDPEHLGQIPEAAGLAHSIGKKVDHVGVYVGAAYDNGVFYNHGVVSSPSYGEPVCIKELDTSYWTHFYMLNFVDYSK